MPRIEVIRIRRWLYAAFTINDFGQVNDVGTGRNPMRATDACMIAHDRRLVIEDRSYR